MEERFALEVLKELKKESQRRFILLVICLALLFASNITWLIAWNLPSTTEEVTESYDLKGEDDANVILNGDGEVKINEPNQSSQIPKGNY